MYPAALRMVGDEADAEELVAETYSRAYAARAERGGASITTWLYRNMARAAENGAPRDGAAGDGAGGDGGPTRDFGPWGVPEPRGKPERLERVPGGTVKDALQRVPARSRFAVYLADVEGFSAATIARILQLPATRVNSRLRRGRRQLRAALLARA
jgi:RNA polymerase sigma-70 factor, ECF subfamily